MVISGGGNIARKHTSSRQQPPTFKDDNVQFVGWVLDFTRYLRYQHELQAQLLVVAAAVHGGRD